MKLTRGDKLTPEQRAAVLRVYVYRLTTENGYAQRNPCRARVPAISDEQWLREHAFYVTKDGHLSNRHGHCEPAYLAEA